MDVFGMERAVSAKRRQKQKRRNDPLKIVYISSPMKVKTCESKFRSLVQELTGKDSQVAMFMEVSSSHDETCKPYSGHSRVEGVVDKLDQSLSPVEEELERYVIDESLTAGGGCGWGLEFPWHLLTG